MLDPFLDFKPAFCGFDVPRREPKIRDSIFLQTESTQETKYKKLERLWDTLWTGLIEEDRQNKETTTTTTISLVESPRDKSVLRKLLRVCLRTTRRRSSVSSFDELEVSSEDWEDFLMPAYPENYRDPVAIY